MSLMLAEIQEQPAALERTLKREASRILRFAASLNKRRIRLIVLVARGSSDNAALFGRRFTPFITREWTFETRW
jgi:glucosamine--fructose-6-phosphate aminotransferase (isomerizing)